MPGNRKFIIAISLLALVSLLILYWLRSDNRQPELRANISEALSGETDIELYQRAIEPIQFRFPEDFGPHPGYQTEWWYYTGNLTTPEGRAFGYQLTFFRRALSPHMKERTSDWATNQVYFAHFAVTDIRSKRFHSFEHFSRGALGLAGAQAEPYRVWVENWQAAGSEKTTTLTAEESSAAIHLDLVPEKPIVLQGDEGLSRKGAKEGNASYYFSQTRIASRGVVTVDGKEYRVTGNSWLDREWSTSALESGDVGWDWFSIQLDDQREIMLFQIRKKDGSISRFSTGKIVYQDGTTRSLENDTFDITVTDWWRSPDTGITYPSGWIIETTLSPERLTVTPRIENQEHLHSFIYWEGAVSVETEDSKGLGYVEMTGYERQ